MLWPFNKHASYRFQSWCFLKTERTWRTTRDSRVIRYRPDDSFASGTHTSVAHIMPTNFMPATMIEKSRSFMTLKIISLQKQRGGPEDIYKSSSPCRYQKGFNVSCVNSNMLYLISHRTLTHSSFPDKCTFLADYYCTTSHKDLGDFPIKQLFVISIRQLPVIFFSHQNNVGQLHVIYLWFLDRQLVLRCKLSSLTCEILLIDTSEEVQFRIRQTKMF